MVFLATTTPPVEIGLTVAGAGRPQFVVPRKLLISVPELSGSAGIGWQALPIVVMAAVIWENVYRHQRSRSTSPPVSSELSISESVDGQSGSQSESAEKTPVRLQDVLCAVSLFF